MIIISEENKQLRGTIHALPDSIIELYKNIVKENPQFVGYPGYEKAKNICKNGKYVTMEWLKGMKHFFTKHKTNKDPNFMLAGGSTVKNFVDQKLIMLTNNPKKQYTQSQTKPRTNASNLSGNRGEKSSKQISISNSIMGGLIPKTEAKV